VDKEEFRSKATVDRVSTTGSVWLGLTVGCAECHTHKFDPIPQREFYQLYAFFNNASESDVPAPRPSELAEYTRELKAWEAKKAEIEPALQSRIAAIDSVQLRHWEESVTVPAARWTTMKPTRVVVAAGDNESVVPAARDNTVAARQKDTVKARFVVDAMVKASGVTGFRVDALPELGRPIGRGDGGDFALAEFSVTLQPPDAPARKLELAKAWADFAASAGDPRASVRRQGRHRMVDCAADEPAARDRVRAEGAAGLPGGNEADLRARSDDDRGDEPIPPRL
jgi:hypothetical protein